MHHFYLNACGRHLLTRVDPRIKLLCSLALLVMVISCKGIIFPLLVAAFSVSLSLAMGVRLRVLAVRFAEPAVIVSMVLVLKCLFSGHDPLFSLNFFGLEIAGQRDGLREGLLIASRIAGAVSVVVATGFATPLTELMAALAWLKVPQTFIEVALFAWRYLFVLFEDAQVVYNAQKNRLGYAGYRRGLRSCGALAGALVIKAFDNSQSITTAMVQRGYDGKMPMMKHRPFRLAEVLCSTGFVAIMICIWEMKI